MRFVVALSLIAACVLFGWGGEATAGPSRELPAKFKKSPFSLMSLSVGAPNDGWQVRAKRLRDGTFLKMKSKSRSLGYGHPALVLMLERSAEQVARADRPRMKMLVGDLSRKGGGPLSGHHSHQSGRDADVGFYVVDSKGKSKLLDDFKAFRGDGTAKDGSGYRFDDYRNWLLIQSWLRDDRAGISHVFVSAPLRARLLRYAQSGKPYRKYVQRAAVLLKQPQDASAHDDHFHVRISCPKRQEEICVEQSR